MSGGGSKNCKGCHNPIQDGQAYKLGSDQWHVECFKCSKCTKVLGVNSNFLVLGTGALVCSDCSYTCKSCEKKIYDLAILTGDLAYCADCFKCKSCNKPIDDLKYARTSKGLFCMPCHNMLIEKKRKYEKMKKLKERAGHSSSGSKSKVSSDTKPHTKSSLNPTKESKEVIDGKDTKDSKDEDTVEMNISFKPALKNLDSGKVSTSDTTFAPPKSTTTSQSLDSSSASTFDLDFYAGSLDKEEHSTYSKPETSSIQESEDYASRDNLEKVDSFPIEKLDVVMDYHLRSPKADLIKENATFDSNRTPTLPDSIPIGKPLDDGFSYMHQDEKESDINIPLRSPKRSALSPMRTTAQFRTPELDTPKKKQTDINLLSPGLNRKVHVLDEENDKDSLEPEPESFINLDETEEESLMSTNLTDSEQMNDTLKGDELLMSPMKVNNEAVTTPPRNVGLNITGLESNGINAPSHARSASVTDPERTPKVVNSMDTPVQSHPSTFDENATPTSKKKQSGGLGRSLTKVFARSKKSPNEFKDHYEPPTPETITSKSSSFAQVKTTPRKHIRTHSDHSYTAYSTPPIPPGRSHIRSASETTQFDSVEHISGTERELHILKGEINSLTLSKATLLRDVQNLKEKVKSLDAEVSNRQKYLKDLDLAISNKSRLLSADELSIANSSGSAKNLSKDDYYLHNNNSSNNNINMKFSSSENIIPEEFIPPPQVPGSTTSTGSGSTGNSSASSGNFNGNTMPNSSNPPNSSTSQNKDKRSGFMRRIFGSHSAVNSATGAQGNPLNGANKTPSVGNISQPTNLRYNDDLFYNSTELSSSIPSANTTMNSEMNGGNAGMKSSRSTNFLQWRNGQSQGHSAAGSQPKSLYSMTLQDLSAFENSNGIPFIVKSCIFEVEKRGIHSEGIYRISASTSTVEKFEQMFEVLNINSVNDVNKLKEMAETADINAFAGLLKRYLKKIPHSIIPQDYYDAYVSINRIVDEQERLAQLSEIISNLPRANQITLYTLAKHLTVIADNEKWNKMNAASLATVFAPTLVRHNNLQPQQEIQDNKAKTVVTELLFRKYGAIFDAVN